MKKLLLAAAVVLVACGESTSPTAGPTPPPLGAEPIDPTATFTRVQTEIFTPTCSAIGCHDPLGRQSQMVLSAGRAYGQIVNVASVEMPQLERVVALDAANSYLYRKITGAGITGESRPTTRATPSDRASCNLWPPGDVIRVGTDSGEGCMSLIRRLLGKDDAPPKPRTRICVECGMPVAEHRDWCSILRGQNAMKRPAPPNS